MPKVYIPHIWDLMWQGFRSGLRWETKGWKIRKDGGYVHEYRFLLHFPGAFHIAKVLAKDLGSTNKVFINRVLADLYDFAASNVDMCGELSAEDFFAVVKGTQAWTVNFKNALFWQFTYRLLHARAIFLDTYVTTDDVPPSTELTKALDKFRDAFFARYDPDTLPEDKKHLDEIDREEYRQFCKDKRTEYFGLSSADCEGDGTDRKVDTFVKDGAVDPAAAQYKPTPAQPNEVETGIGFYHDLGHGTPTYGHTELGQSTPEKTQEK